MTSSMQGKGLAAPDPEPSTSVNMANLTRLSVLIGEADADRSRETAELLKQLGVRDVVQVRALAPLLEALRKQAFDVLICAERLGGEDGVAVLRAARNVAPATRSVLMRTNDRAGEFVPDDIEAVELPFSRLKLQGLLHRTAAPQGGLWCEVPELSLTDILQMYHQTRGSIVVLLSGPIAGRIWLEGGDIIDAEANGERGMSALSLLLEAESGLVRTEPPKGPVTRTISAPFQSVILEAARKLDERRRDSLSGGPPAASQAGSSLAAVGASGRYSTLPPGGGSERPSLAGAVLRPAMTPPIEAPAPSPESFLASTRRERRRSWAAMLGVLLGLGVAGVAASYVGNRVGSSQDREADDTPDVAANAPNATVQRASDVEPPPRAPARAPAAPAAPAPAPSSAARPGVASPERAPSPSPGPAPTTPRVAAPATRANASFELYITSEPPRATVNEGNRALGKTPLRLTISKASLADGPREFILRLAGYLPVKISQAASGSDVEAAVVLSPRPTAFDTPDGGLYEPELEVVDSAGSRSGNTKARRKDLGIRLRR
jgi:CheY-like chemotaxis protein